MTNKNLLKTTYTYDVEDMTKTEIKDIVKTPGSGGNIFRKLAHEKINIDLIYLGENKKLIIGVDDLKKARTVL